MVGYIYAIGNAALIIFASYAIPCHFILDTLLIWIIHQWSPRLVDWYRNKGSFLFCFLKIWNHPKLKKNTAKYDEPTLYSNFLYWYYIAQPIQKLSYKHSQRLNIKTWTSVIMKYNRFKINYIQSVWTLFIPNLTSMHNILNAKLNMALLVTIK